MPSWLYNPEIISTVITGILGITAVSLFMNRGIKIMKEIAELLQVIVVAVADGKITPEEIEQIKKESMDVINVAKKVFSKPKSE